MPSFTPLADPACIVAGPHVRFSLLTDRLLRLEYDPADNFEDRPSQAFWFRRQPVPQFTSQVSVDVIHIETEFLRLEYLINPAGFTRLSLSILLKQTGRTWHYGMRPRGNLGGTARTLDGIAGRTRLGQGLISRSGWAVVDDSESLIFDSDGRLAPRQASTTLDLYFFGYGGAFADCLRDFTRIAGPIPLIPRYILGNWWSRYWAYSQAELQSLMEDFRSHAIPLSVCIIDMDWHITQTGNNSSGWTGYTWNRALFPDPPGFIHWLHDQGLRTALNLHPASGIHSHEEQYEEMARWMGIDPTPSKPIPFDISDPHFMDGYFKILHHPQEDLGVDFWWLDWQQGKKSRMPGLDPLWALNHMHYQDLGRDGHKRPFVFSRWGGLGNHRYPIGFSGDTIINWKSLRFQPRFTSTAANVGYGWWSHDIGGHMWKDLTPELFLRWVQFGLFSPILRLHATNKPGLDRRPWTKPERFFKAIREAMQLRHAFIPYLYTMAWRAYKTGLSPLLPMYYLDGSKDAFDCPDQYAFGSELLAAPVLTPVSRATGTARQRIWLPAGTWFNFFTGEKFENGWHTIHSTLEEIPVFAKSGAIVTLGPKSGWGGIINPETLDIYLFPGAQNLFELYEDDGETTGYMRGEYALTAFTLEPDGDGLKFTVHPVSGDIQQVPSERTYRIHLRGVDEKASCAEPAEYDFTTRSLNLEPIRLAVDKELIIHFSHC